MTSGQAHVVRLRITEVGPRDGLQSDPRAFSVDARVDFVDALSEAGFPEIEVGSFVNPRAVPQMAESGAVFAKITRRAGTIYSALVPNLRGLEGALAARSDKVSVFAAASETFSEKNGGASIAETIARLEPVIARSRDAGLPVRGYVSCIVKCPYEGAVDVAAVVRVSRALHAAGAQEIDLADTIGVAEPDDMERILSAVRGAIPDALLTLHLHDTAGRALACVERAVGLGVHSFDSSAGGLGGCPFAPGAPGNLSTERLLERSESRGWVTGVNGLAVRRASDLLRASHRGI